MLMAQKHIALINPKTVNTYYHFNHGGIDRLFVCLFRRFYDKRIVETVA